MRKFVGDALLLGAFVITKSCMEIIEEKMRNKDKEALERNLIMMSIIYHVIGIFYNE